ncbi:hypothetical protein BSLA_02r4745 [Burkholderia stabilis]|nr:hypothetical protein BSLA_02r4745 [Burkholderia stabilis]
MGQDTGRRGHSRPHAGLIVDRRLRASAPHPACRRRARVARAQRSRRRTKSTARIERAAAGLRIGDDGPAPATRAGRCRPTSRAAAPSLARKPLYHRPRAVK